MAKQKYYTASFHNGGKKEDTKDTKGTKKTAKKITIDNQMNHIPPFVNVKNKPLLLLDTTEIKKLSRKDYKYAKQYSSVRSLNPNPRWPFD